LAKRTPLSASFHALRARIKELKDNLLPSKASIAAPSLGVQTRALAFRVLAHAEIESFIEERARSVVEGNLDGWKKDKRPRTVLMAVLGFCGDEWQSADDISASKAKKTEQTLETRLHLAAKKYGAILDGNHGVRERNLLRILVPLGVSKAELDTTWLATMDSFGGARGSAAHTSGSSVAINPADEAKTVNDIIEGLKAVDRILSSLV
jgi:hypothetical protein